MHTPPKSESPFESKAFASASHVRIVLASLSCGLFWGFVIALPYLDLATYPRFFARHAANTAFLSLLLLLWLTWGRFPIVERLLAVVTAVATGLLLTRLADKSLGGTRLLQSGIPIVATAGALWFGVTRRSSLAAARCGLYGVPVVVFGCLTLLRWEGLDGNQRGRYAWRWTPTGEDRFLADQPETPSDEPARELELPWVAEQGDWPEFRGPGGAGVVRDLPEQNWNERPPRLIWRRRVGPGWSSMIVVSGRLVTFEQRGADEAVVCYSAETGEEKWVHAAPGRLREGLAGVGPRSTPAYRDGRIFALGAQGRLSCLRVADGSVLWTRNILEEAGAGPPQFGVCGSPLVVDGLVVVFAGGAGQSVLAFRDETGERAWSCAAGKLSYCTPQIVTIGGARQIVCGASNGVFAVRPDNGQILWSHLLATEYDQPMLQPHVGSADSLVIARGAGVARVVVRKNEVGWVLLQAWDTERMKPSLNEFAVHKDHVYGLDNGLMCCLDMKSGQRLWKRGRYGSGQLLLIPDQDRLLMLTEEGEVALIAADPAAHRELGRFSAISGKTWNHPAVAHGRLYVRNGEEMACFNLTGAAPQETGGETTKRRGE